MTKTITYKNWYEAENNDLKREGARLCECGHVEELHNQPDDYCIDTWCNADDCHCEKFRTMIRNNKIVYDGDLE